MDIKPIKTEADYAAALAEIYADPAFQEAMTNRGFGLRWRDAVEFQAFMQGQEETVRPLVAELGL